QRVRADGGHEVGRDRQADAGISAISAENGSGEVRRVHGEVLVARSREVRLACRAGRRLPSVWNAGEISDARTRAAIREDRERAEKVSIVRRAARAERRSAPRPHRVPYRAAETETASTKGDREHSRSRPTAGSKIGRIIDHDILFNAWGRASPSQRQ